MKRKEYITPNMKIEEETITTALLAGSGVTSEEIGYGGVDEEGTIDPQAPGYFEY